MELSKVSISLQTCDKVVPGTEGVIQKVPIGPSLSLIRRLGVRFSMSEGILIVCCYLFLSLCFV